ncbi:MAG: lipid-A-disaccharide synthase [Candidatus Cloacimonetes bacterium]|nr:lipid-A-disaccharide synthase [Candidatus Cloacimonadota bacterium]NLO11079.1 lipid-A-disaccharide synthase [Candidatus Cloacimonadota bacterium]
MKYIRRYHIFWLVGENSGDLHASLVMKSLNAQIPDIRHTGIGGPRMQALGLKPLYPFHRFAVMGFVEVLRHLFFFWKVEAGIKRHLKREKPDLVILVDYPGLNLRIANITEHQRLPVLYFICPQFWAWKHERVFKLKQRTNHVACILPFEKEMLDIHNINSSYVGHPISEEIQIELDREAFARFYKLDPAKQWLGFMPGSRNSEIQRMLPTFLEAAAKFDPQRYEFLFSKARSVDHQLYMDIISSHKDVRTHIVDGYTYEMMKYSSFMISTSGTATLECAYLETPVLIGYKANPISYLIGRRLVRVKRIGLPNIVLDKDVLPELVQNDLTPQSIFDTVTTILNDPQRLADIRKELSLLRGMLSTPRPSEEMPRLISKMLNIDE